MEKVALTFSFPIRIKRNSNGEKIIIPGDARDDVEIRIVEDEAKSCESPLVAIRTLLNTSEKNLGTRLRRKKSGQADGLHE